MGEGQSLMVNWIRKKTRYLIFDRDNWTCIYCNQRESKLTLDHIIPKKLGKDNRPSNLLTCCSYCNNKKGGASLKLFLFRLKTEGFDVKEIKRRIKNATRRRLKK